MHCSQRMLVVQSKDASWVGHLRRQTHLDIPLAPIPNAPRKKTRRDVGILTWIKLLTFKLCTAHVSRNMFVMTFLVLSCGLCGNFISPSALDFYSRVSLGFVMVSKDNLLPRWIFIFVFLLDF